MWNKIEEFSMLVWGWLWDIISSVGITIWKFLTATFDNMETIAPILAYVVASVVGLFVVMKVLSFVVSLFSSLNKNIVGGFLKKFLIVAVTAIVILSLGVFLKNTVAW